MFTVYCSMCFCVDAHPLSRSHARRRHHANRTRSRVHFCRRTVTVRPLAYRREASHTPATCTHTLVSGRYGAAGVSWTLTVSDATCCCLTCSLTLQTTSTICSHVTIVFCVNSSTSTLHCGQSSSVNDHSHRGTMVNVVR